MIRFVETNYEPIKNPYRRNEDHFKTFGPERYYVANQPMRKVWSIMDSNSGSVVVIPGMQKEAKGYLVTKEPWHNEAQCYYWKK